MLRYRDSGWGRLREYGDGVRVDETVGLGRGVQVVVEEPGDGLVPVRLGIPTAAFALTLATSLGDEESPALLEAAARPGRVTMYATGNDRVYQSGGDQYIIER